MSTIFSGVVVVVIPSTISFVRGTSIVSCWPILDSRGDGTMESSATGPDRDPLGALSCPDLFHTLRRGGTERQKTRLHQFRCAGARLSNFIPPRYVEPHDGRRREPLPTAHLCRTDPTTTTTSEKNGRPRSRPTFQQHEHPTQVRPFHLTK